MKIITFILLFFYCSIGIAQTPQPIYPTSNYDGTAFGREVKIYGDEFLISSRNPPQLLGGSGKVFLFKETNDVITQTAFFYPTDALVTDNFGVSIAIENDLVAIGSPFHDANFDNSGAVYLYKRTNGIWNLLQKITAYDGAIDDNFGSFVTIHNNQLFISAKNDDLVLNSQSEDGSVYIYDVDGTNVTFSQKFPGPTSSQFGTKIEIENNKMVIENSHASSDGIFFSTYTYDGTNWTLQNTTDAIGDLEQLYYDFSLSNNQLFVLITSFFGERKFQIYDDIDNSWILSTSTYITESPDQRFSKIEVVGDVMLLGSTDYIVMTERKFPVLLYKKVDGTWLYQNTFYGLGEDATDDQFGYSIALSSNFAVIGAPQEGAIATGKAYYFGGFLNTNNFQENAFQIFPNPVKEFVNVKNNSAFEIDTVELYSITGKLLFTKNSNFDQISLAQFSTGMYFLKLNFNKTGTQTFKILKN